MASPENLRSRGSYVHTGLTSAQLKELYLASTNVFEFAKSVSVIHPLLGKVPFNLYPYQMKLLWYFVTERFNIVLKFRQAGVTELISMYCLWLAMYHSLKNIQIISIKDRVAKKVLRKIKYMYKNLPNHLKTPIINGRPGEFGCVTPDTMLTGLSCDFRIGDICPLLPGILNVEHLGIKVLTHKGTFERVLHTINKGVRKTLTIVNDRGKVIRCAENHSFYTTKGWKLVSEILDKNLDVIFWDTSYLSDVKAPTTPKPTKEIIKPTKYSGYFVSNLGNVYTKRWLKREAPGKLIKMNLRDNGHLRVRFKISGKGKFISVHRLVYETFIGKIPKGYIVDHIDCNMKNNCITNLQCITMGDNTHRAHLYNRSMKNMNYRLTSIPLKNLGKLKSLSKSLGNGYGTGKVIADSLGLSTKQVSHYRRGKSCEHIYTSKISLEGISEELIVDLEVENHHSYITDSHYINHNTAQEMEFSNGSIITSIPTTEDAGRSEAVSLLVIDEAAIIRWANVIWAAAFPTLSTGGASIVASTPFGMGNWYHKTYTDALAGGNTFKPLRLRWQMHPERDIKWYNEMASALGPRRTAQEIDGDFLTSGNSVFDLVDIKAIEETLSEYVVLEVQQNGNLQIMKNPIPGKQFFIGADVATGRSRDYSAFSVMDSSGEEYAYYKGKISTSAFADLLAKTGKRYNNAVVAPETNDIGEAVTRILQREGYPKLYHFTQLLKAKGEKRPKEQKFPGWLTTTKNRGIIIGELEEDIRLDNIIVKDPFFVQEAYTFIYDNNNRPVAMGKDNKLEDDPDDDQTYTDDAILAKAITNFIRKGRVSTVVVAPQ